MRYKKLYSCIGFVLALTLIRGSAGAQLNIAAAKALIGRVIPGKASSFIVEELPSADQKDVFEIQSRGHHIVLKGNNGVAVASALYYYLKQYCHCQITWNGSNLNLPTVLPEVREKIHRQTPYEYRYYLNYCTFNYSMCWWDWDRWQKEIDWMALHGINMPLALTGEAYTWDQVYKEMGFSDKELEGFFSGPAYFSWLWMGNLDAWGGPLPISWMKSHYELQKKILKRQRALGMTPVLPAFTGHVPAAFKTKFPQAKLKTVNWHCGFADTYILDAEDPLFAKIGRLFLEEQTKLFGTDHLYSADTFNENEPPSDDPAYLGKLSARVYEGMHQFDTAAIWVMQGWLFYSDRKFWKQPQIEALLEAVPNNKMIILDLFTEMSPVWNRTKAFYGKPWIWNMLNNFGGNTNLFGNMKEVASGPSAALHNPQRGRLSGIGLTPEGIEQNPALYELMMDNTWRETPIDLDKWIPAYVLNRYGSTSSEAVEAWQILRKTVYCVPPDKYKRDGAESIIEARPTFDSTAPWVKTALNYNPADLLPAWDALVKASAACGNSDGFQFDLLDVTRQVLANYASKLHQKFKEAYDQKDPAAFKKYSQAFISLIEDLDDLLATRKDFLLGPWIADARKWGTDDKERDLYERNAKDLITLWGDKQSPLHEYACRQWSGLLDDFYKPRWQQFFAQVKIALNDGNAFDQTAFDKGIKDWEWKWVNERKDYPVVPKKGLLAEVQKLYAQYRTQIL